MTNPLIEWTSVNVAAWLTLAAGLLVSALCLVLSRQSRIRGRMVLRVGGLLLLARMLLFENPIAWEAYARFLAYESVGWRQLGVVQAQRDSYLQPQQGVRYLAVGSSQTEALYDNIAAGRPDLETLLIPGMKPVDLVLYRDHITKRQPETVLLYLSDFDLACVTPLNFFSVTPTLGTDVMWMRSMLPRLTVEGNHNAAITGLFLGEVSPEFKYGFVLRGVVDEMFERGITTLPATPKSYPRRTTEQKIAELRETFDERFITPNLECVELFLEHAGQQGVDVCILEGRYSPLAANEKLDGLRARARDGLERLSSSLEHVTYVRSSELGELDEADFRDPTHVHWEVGERLSGALIEHLEKGSVDTQYNPAANPMARNSEHWQQRVQLLEERIQKNPDARLLFIGDSITHAWETNGAEIWARYYDPRDAINLGVSADRTEHVLWRIQEANWDFNEPAVVVLMIGLNNVAVESQSVAEIVEGIGTVADRLHESLPQSRIVLLSLLPAGTDGGPLGPRVARVNLELPALRSRPFLHYLDLYPHFLDSEGNASMEFMQPDRIHLNSAGYEHWAALMAPLLDDLMGPGSLDGQSEK